MRKIKNFVIGGIENKLFNLILVTVLLISAAFMAAIFYQSRMLSKLTSETNKRQQESIVQITTNVMDAVAQQSMDQATELESMIANELFHGLETRVQMLGDYATRLFSDPAEVSPKGFARPRPALDGTVTAQLILADGVDASSPELNERLGIAANMSDMMISLFGASEVTNSCFIALPEGAFLIVDDRSANKFDDDGSFIKYDPTTRPWYTQAVEEGKLIFTDVEIDAFTGDIGIVCAMPVYHEGKLEAVVGSDLFLTSMQEAVQASDENGGFVCIVNQNGHVVFSPRKEGQLCVLSSSEAVDLRQSENEQLASFVSDAMRGKTEVRKVDLDDGSYYMAGAPMETVGWALIDAFAQDRILQPVSMLQDNYEQIQQEAVAIYRDSSGKSRLTILVLLLFLFILLSTGALILGKRIVKPLNTITRRISQLSERNLEFKMEDAYRTGDEIEVMAESFANISHRTVEYMKQVKTVTAEKERINTELQMAKEIQESMLPDIFPAFPDRSEFEIYAMMEPAKAVGGDFYDFFLIDHDHLCIVMADVSGKGIPAALFMMASKIILQSCAMLGRSVADILTKTNEALCSNNRMEMFVTVWLGILEISTGKVTAANAGHEYPVLKKGDSFELIRDRHGFVIGGMDEVTYQEYTLQMEPGDKLFLYTDGVPEATNLDEDLFTTARMLKALNQAPECDPEIILEKVRKAVEAFVGNAEQFDDLTMLCIEYKGNSEA